RSFFFSINAYSNVVASGSLETHGFPTGVPCLPPRGNRSFPYRNSTPFGYFEYKDISKGLAKAPSIRFLTRPLSHTTVE
ncbi:MAG: hypothetical protein WC059_03680, partial [Candidatus Paceibacterota bacterium]